jgi:hypothetical protein
MYVIKIGNAYFTGTTNVDHVGATWGSGLLSTKQKDAKRFHSATQMFRDYVTLLFGDARFVKLVPKRRDVSPLDVNYDDAYYDDRF